MFLLDCHWAQHELNTNAKKHIEIELNLLLNVYLIVACLLPFLKSLSPKIQNIQTELNDPLIETIVHRMLDNRFCSSFQLRIGKSPSNRTLRIDFSFGVKCFSFDV